MTERSSGWLITCSCGLGRTALSALAATAIGRRHARLLFEPGTEHTITIEEPPASAAHRQPELPLATGLPFEERESAFRARPT